ncbi:hypothetical protein DT076_05305 [Desertihabitans brevis]|uniref:DUF2530 domain-containing protein n=1 Tax=Desertihabitans brevis TaxID=2268447 RepID=A0A367YY39_9ACTN|nr:hypothetical protein [Desertihabitans brevis]RCK70806.1 hypothetical protein DT076_05305 [Desertihabitans brevis]
MAFDWKRLERQDRERVDRAGLGMGLGWLVGGVLALVGTRLGWWSGGDSAVVGVVLGVVFLAAYGFARRRRAGPDR